MEESEEGPQTIMDNYPYKQKQRPRHLERILLANHKEQLGLQRRLDTINNSRKRSGKALDRERYQVNTELQYTQRINYHTITPYLDKVPVMLKHAYPHVPKVDPVTVFLLREYKRNGQVIPDILATLDLDEEERQKILRKKRQHPGEEADRHVSFNLNQHNDDSKEEVHKYRDKHGDPDPHKLADLVREIARIRNEILSRNRVHLSRHRLSFEELLRYVQDREELGSDSSTYTDGTCVLLRRKMNRMRQLYNQNIGIEEDSRGLRVKYRPPPRIPKLRKWNKKEITSNLMQLKPPTVPIGRTYSANPLQNVKTLACNKRKNTLEEELALRRQLEFQERQVTDIKVGKEMEEYSKIHGKIVDFLERNKQKTQYPLLFDEDQGQPEEPAS